MEQKRWNSPWTPGYADLERCLTFVDSVYCNQVHGVAFGGKSRVSPGTSAGWDLGQQLGLCDFIHH